MRTKLSLPVVLRLQAVLAGLPIAAGEAGARMPLLMPDDFAERRLWGWRVEPGQPDPRNPLIEGEMPWDRGGVGTHGGPMAMFCAHAGPRPERIVVDERCATAEGDPWL